MKESDLKIFEDIPDDIDATWINVALLGGTISGLEEHYSLALHFKYAGDILVQRGLKIMEPYELVYPILFMYRHAIELYLKAIVKPAKRNHDLSSLLGEFVLLVKEKHSEDVPKWFTNRIQEFIENDPRSTTFRYGDEDKNISLEVMVDLSKLKETMEILAEGFRRVYFA